MIVHSDRAVVLSLSETNLQRPITGKSKLASNFLMNLASFLARFLARFLERFLAMKLTRKRHHSQEF